MRNYFAALFKEVRHEISLMFLLSLTDTDVLKQSKITDHGIKIMDNLALEKLHTQKTLKENLALQLLD